MDELIAFKLELDRLRTTYGAQDGSTGRGFDLETLEVSFNLKQDYLIDTLARRILDQVPVFSGKPKLEMLESEY